jgi:RNA polymerase sigma-70 factor, ECF subfamily
MQAQVDQPHLSRPTATDKPTASQEEDIDLLRRLTLRDEQALLTLYHKYQRLVYSLALRVLKEEPEAQELLQEVFLHVWEKASMFDRERGSFDAWLVTLTHHRAIDVLRTRRYKQRATEDRVDPDVLAGMSTENTILDRTGLTESIEKDEREKVRLAMEEISTEQKQVLELAYYEGYSQSEIAELLKIPLGTVKTRMRQGMIKLSRHLKNLRYQPD